MNISVFVKIFCDYLMIFAPSIGYIVQGLTFKNTQSSDGFSLYICLILLFANIMRVFFWFGKTFTIVLLYQSLVVIVSQFYLIHMYLKYSNYKGKSFQIKKSFLSLDKVFNKKLFWKWDNVSEYFIFIFISTMMFYLFCLGVNGLQNIFFVELIGAISVFSESIIAIPQIKENNLKKNCDNISLFMISSWLIGDIFKSGYYIFSGSPIQFIICGFFQVSLDIILTSQVIYYKNCSHKHSNNNIAKNTISVNINDNDEDDENIPFMNNQRKNITIINSNEVVNKK